MATSIQPAQRHTTRQPLQARRPNRGLVLGALGIASALACFQLLAALDIVSARYVPPPTVLARAVVELATDPAFAASLWATLSAWGLAVLIVGVLGSVLGAAIGSFGPMRRATSSLIELMRPIPSVGLLPAAVLLFGLGSQMKVLLACYAAFWPVLLNTIYGVSEVDRVLLSTARTFRWGRFTTLRRVVLPSAAPFMATGLRLASAVALIVVLTTELLVARAGLGTVIRLYQEAARNDLVYAGIVVTGVIGLVSNTALGAVERRLLHWTPAHRRA